MKNLIIDSWDSVTGNPIISPSLSPIFPCLQQQQQQQKAPLPSRPGGKLRNPYIHVEFLKGITSRLDIIRDGTLIYPSRVLWRPQPTFPFFFFTRDRGPGAQVTHLSINKKKKKEREGLSLLLFA